MDSEWKRPVFDVSLDKDLYWDRKVSHRCRDYKSGKKLEAEKELEAERSRFGRNSCSVSAWWFLLRWGRVVQGIEQNLTEPTLVAGEFQATEQYREDRWRSMTAPKNPMSRGPVSREDASLNKEPIPTSSLRFNGDKISGNLNFRSCRLFIFPR